MDILWIGAALLFITYGVVYLGAVTLGQLTLRRARRTPGGERAAGYTFVGRPLGERYFDPWRAERYFRDGEYATLVDPQLVRRAQLVRRLLGVKNRMLPVVAVVGLALWAYGAVSS